MSDNYLRLIPTDPRYVPPADQAAAAVEIATFALPQADVIQAEHHGRPVFIDQGTNLEAIICPVCRARSALHDERTASIAPWWYNVAASLEGRNVVDVKVRMPCCNALVPFPDLEFDWPAKVASSRSASGIRASEIHSTRRWWRSWRSPSVAG